MLTKCRLLLWLPNQHYCIDNCCIDKRLNKNERCVNERFFVAFSLLTLFVFAHDCCLAMVVGSGKHVGETYERQL